MLKFLLKDGYKENNRLKKRAWIIIPLALLIISVLALFGNYSNTSSEPKIIEQYDNGMLLQLPVISADRSLGWQAQRVASSSVAQQQVAQSLSQFRADFKQLRPQLLISTQPGSPAREDLALRLGKTLAQHDLGRVEQRISAPPIPENYSSGGMILYCAEEDWPVARELLAALTPYISGHVLVHYDNDIGVQAMRLYLYGVPYFNSAGQATFDSTSASGNALTTP